jgi:site-specific DNA-methyltransferase (adenine-specific)
MQRVIWNATLYIGDCIEVMAGMEENSVDAIVTDPPYLLSFMGKAFDRQHKALAGDNEGQQMQAWHSAWVKQAYRVLKPGGYLLAFGGSRTVHRLMSALEDAGFWMHPVIGWVNGQSFPKATNLSKMLDRDLGLEREVVGMNKYANRRIESSGPENGDNCYGQYGIPKYETAPASPEAAQWEGWFYGRQSLKPAMEPICHAQKPPEGRMVDNVRKWGTGAINVGATRVGYTTVDDGNLALNPHLRSHINGGNGGNIIAHEEDRRVVIPNSQGRWPPHLLLDGSEEVKALFPDRKTTWVSPNHANNRNGEFLGGLDHPGQQGFNDSGSAARFFPHLGYSEHDLDIPPIFYCAKASKRDRDQGCEMLEAKTGSEVTNRNEGSVGLIGDNNNRGQTANPYANGAPLSRNFHPTAKPTSLMRWLCRLVVPPGGVVLDPFMGSGSTLKAACLENMRCIGIEMDEEYFEIACARVAYVSPEAVMVKTPSKPTVNAPAQGSLL